LDVSFWDVENIIESIPSYFSSLGIQAKSKVIKWQTVEKAITREFVGVFWKLVSRAKAEIIDTAVALNAPIVPTSNGMLMSPAYAAKHCFRTYVINSPLAPAITALGLPFVDEQLVPLSMNNKVSLEPNIRVRSAISDQIKTRT